MNSMGLDFFAPFYRYIAQLFFGKTQKLGYQTAANYYKSGKALFVGAGDGHYLPYFSNAFSQIDFLDISEGMLQQVGKTSHYNPRTMRCLHADFSDVATNEMYDTIYMLFYLDMLSMAQKREHVEKALSLLSENGQLIVLDFKPGGFGQQLKLFFARVLFTLLTFSKIPKVSDVTLCLSQLSHVNIENVLESESLLLARLKPEAITNTQ